MAADLPTHAERKWVRACVVDDIPEDEGFVLQTVPPTSVFRYGEELFCIDDTCTHETFSLAEGWQDGCIIECTLHNAKFDLRTGAVASPPAVKPIRTHPVAAQGDEIFVALPQAYLVKVDAHAAA